MTTTIVHCGAFGGGGNGSYISCASNVQDDPETQVYVFIRAGNRDAAKALVLEKLPGARFQALLSQINLQTDVIDIQ